MCFTPVRAAGSAYVVAEVLSLPIRAHRFIRLLIMVSLCLTCHLGWSQWTLPNSSNNINNTNSGFVGIGLTNPYSKLQVWGGDFSITGTDLNGTAVVTSRGGLAFFGANSYSNGMAVTSSGNILIGQTTQVNSSYKLDVAGSIRGNKIVVNTTGADFVFDANYHLPSLDEVRTFIGKNHHLPGIDSAAQMKKNGLDIGDNQTRLLQKIEELTLYMIDLNKKNELLQRQVEDLKILVDRNTKSAVGRTQSVIGNANRQTTATN